jgi:hypothetical protein
VLVRTGVTAAVAALIALRHPGFALVIGAVAAATLAMGLWLPRAYAAVERGLSAFGRGVGLAISTILLTTFFFLVFVPGRLILLLARRDPMRRAFPGGDASFWIPYRPSGDPDHYRKQYR